MSRWISTVDCTKKCPERGEVASYHRAGVAVAPGVTIEYVVRVARAGLADCTWEVDHADLLFFGRVLSKAWGEVAAGLGQSTRRGAAG